MAIIKNGVGGVGVHRALSNLSGRKLILDADGDTSITADTDDQIDIEVAGNDELRLTATALYPVTDDGLDLGIVNTNEWGNLFLADGAVINFNNSDVTLTHASNKLTIAGGVLSGMTHSIFAAPHAVSGEATLSASHQYYAVANVGSASADGVAYITLRVPSDYVTLKSLQAHGKPDGTADLVWTVTTRYAATGQSGHATHTGAVSAKTLAGTDNVNYDLDISQDSSVSSLAANDMLAIAFQVEGAGASAVNNFKVYGVTLEYTT
tara:strand:+ start:495 stop:1289 length:795 start_codon:yes stop_codon:yes gene_type:complete